MAVAILSSYVHINEDEVVHAVSSTIRSLSTDPRFGRREQRLHSWVDFLDNVVISFPLGESEDPTGSGYIFARMAKTRLSFREDQVFEPAQLIRNLAINNREVDLIMLDDIAASGNQFVRAWSRKVRTDGGEMSLADYAENGTVRCVTFHPVVCTLKARRRIEENTPVRVVPTYLIGEDYGCLSENTRLVPDQLREGVAEFLERNSPRTGRDEFGPAGYGRLGLALSFHHGCPNNTLPVLQWGTCSTNWKALVS